MKQFLQLFWKRSSHSIRTEQVAATESATPQLPPILGRDEYVARFIFDRRYIDKNGKAKSQAFKPECYQGNWEASVCRNTGAGDDRIWEIARTCRPGQVGLARADVGMDAVHDAELMAKAAPGSFEEHAVILGWPVSSSKDAQMMRQVKLAMAASTLLAPRA